jgi:ArsR family transcriptional regulator, arsenate/arsenite/antimonite-responsive transcriptional repressor / arsenate reductase (thioredoxin)
MMRVLFLCTGNSARSQMAEALLRHLTGGAIDAVSAGSAPAADVHPLTRPTLKARYGIEAPALRPKPASELAGQSFDAVITVCDAAAAACPTWPGAARLIHWDIADPAAVAEADARPQAFDDAARELETRIRKWIESPEIRPTWRAQP